MAKLRSVLAALVLAAAALAAPGACLGAGDPPSDKDLAKLQFAELMRRFEAERAAAAPVRIETIVALGEIRSDDAAEFLIQNLEKELPENQAVLVAMFRALGANGTEKAVVAALTSGFRLLEEAYFSELGDALSRVRDPKAVTWLLTKGWRTLPTLPAKAQAQFVRAIEGTADPRMARAANDLLGNRQCPTPIQTQFVRILRMQKDTSAARKIARLYQVDDRELKVEVLLALRDLEASAHGELFRQGLKSDHWQVRSVAVDILAGTHQPELLSLVTPLMKDPEQAVQISVVQALRRLGTRDAIEPLIAGLDAGLSGRLRDDIADALMWLTGKDFGVDPIAWQSWWQENRETVEIKGITREEFERLQREQEDGSTGRYYGLRVLSDHLTFIVDVSASMEEPYNVTEEDVTGTPGGEGSTGVSERGRRRAVETVMRRKIEVAKRELVRCIRDLAEGVRFNLFKFSGDYHAWQPSLITLDSRVRNEAIQWVEGLGPGGTTNVFDTLAGAFQDTTVNTIFFLSDGAPTAGTIQDTDAILAKIAELNRARKVKINTIGFHLDAEATRLMQGLAEQNYGRFVSR